MRLFFAGIFTILTSAANALTCVDQTNAGYSIDFKNGVLQGAHVDSETVEYPVVQYTVLKKKMEEASDSSEIVKSSTKPPKVTRILKVEYKASQFKLVVDYSQKVNWKQSSDTGKSEAIADAKNLAYPATAVVKGKSSKLYCAD